LPIVEQVAAGLRFEADMLDGEERADEEERIRALDLASKPAAAAAVKTYGKKYPSNWAVGSLYDRATRHGLGPDYEVYRLTSSVLHGAAGGALGMIRKVHDDGTTVHRLGPALALCPLAYLRGLTYHQLTVQALVDSNERPDVAERAVPLLNALDTALHLWPEYRRAVLALDEEMWATAKPVSTLMTVLALERDGTASWWLWDLITRRVARARPPADTAATRSDLRVCRAQLPQLKEVYWQNRRHVIIVLTHMALIPPGLRWQESASLIHEERPEIVYSRGEKIVRVEKGEFAPEPLLQCLIPSGWRPMLSD